MAETSVCATTSTHTFRQNHGRVHRFFAVIRAHPPYVTSVSPRHSLECAVASENAASRAHAYAIGLCTHGAVPEARNVHCPLLRTLRRGVVVSGEGSRSPSLLLLLSSFAGHRGVEAGLGAAGAQGEHHAPRHRAAPGPAMCRRTGWLVAANTNMCDGDGSLKDSRRCGCGCGLRGPLYPFPPALERRIVYIITTYNYDKLLVTCGKLVATYKLQYRISGEENEYNIFQNVRMEHPPADARAAPSASEPNDIVMDIASSPKRPRDPAQDNK
eukprot:scaffold34550_cov253-Isochrysis_galbana.AAC.1